MAPPLYTPWTGYATGMSLTYSLSLPQVVKVVIPKSIVPFTLAALSLVHQEGVLCLKVVCRPGLRVGGRSDDVKRLLLSRDPCKLSKVAATLISTTIEADALYMGGMIVR